MYDYLAKIILLGPSGCGKFVSPICSDYRPRELPSILNLQPPPPPHHIFSPAHTSSALLSTSN